jgi:hypothetical protein
MARLTEFHRQHSPGQGRKCSMLFGHNAFWDSMDTIKMFGATQIRQSFHQYYAGSLIGA